MSIPHKYLNDHIRPALCLLAFVAVSGCQWLTGGGWREDAVLPATDHSGDLAVLARDLAKDDQGRSHSVWIRAIRTADANDPPSHCRWSCPAIEDIISRPSELRPDLHAYLHDSDSIVAIHAAIFLARAGDSAGAKRLAEAVRNPGLRLPMRCAAVEALANLSSQDAMQELHKLIDQYGRRTADGRSAYNAELHAELIRGLARHVDPADGTYFIDALGSRSAEVRLEALRAWSASRHGALPEEAAKLCDDRDRSVRVAALTAVAKLRHPRAHEYIAGAINDHDLQVRITAVGALGELRDARARESLEKLLKNPAERIRAEAVTALAKLEAKPSVLEAVDDRSWRVRLSVAKSLGRYPDRDGTVAAMQLLDDPSSRVAQAVVTAVAEWPLDKSGAILLEAMAGDSFQVRKLAAEQLAERWPEAAEFTASASPPRRREVLEKLQGEFCKQFSVVDLNKPSDPRSLSPREVSPQNKPGGSPEIFKLLDRLDTSDTALRRLAATKLAEAARRMPLGRQAVVKLYKLVEAEPDQAVWRSVLIAVSDDPSEQAALLAYAAIGHTSPEVRRRACEHLAAHPDPLHAKVLTASLQDTSNSVVCAAIRALGAAGRLDDVEPLRCLQGSANEQIRLETALALMQLGDPAGKASLERLSNSLDAQVRRRVAVAMGKSGDAVFTATLIRMLDDKITVSRAALLSLPKVVDKDVSQCADDSTPPTTTERMHRWKRWHEGRQGLGAGERVLPNT